MQTLNPLTMPLVGQNLIEASAGTGKTYTITGLYLRYILGMKTPGEQGQVLNVDQILVVTFTEAATQEIRERVRARIIDTRDALLGQATKDEFIDEILKQIKDKHEAFDLLDAAAKSMDEAAIFTIHGFCQRMLKQHAFESGLAFNLEFVLDDNEIIFESVKDFWRSFVYPLNAEKTKAVLGQFASPQALLQPVKALLNNTNAVVTPKITLSEIWAAKEQYAELVVKLKQACIDSDFVGAVSASDLSGSKTPGRKNSLAALLAFIQGDSLQFEFGTNKYSFEIWSSEHLGNMANYKKNGKLFEHELITMFDEVAALNDFVKSGLSIAILQEASAWLVDAIDKRKKQQSVITPDDLLTSLHKALNKKHGLQLAQKIAQLYPVAMIDEFQDTDPIQYGIFQKVYGGADKSDSTDVDSTISMIGDPKQAVYGFRGADIFTYIQAKQAITQSKQYTLSTNYRSSEALVSAVNTLFSKNDDSFIYNEQIPFIPVKAKGKKPEQQFRINGQAPSVLDIAVFKDDAAESKSSASTKEVGQSCLATHFAHRIKTLLERAQRGEALIGDNKVSTADICVLVRDRFEAQAIKESLNEVGLTSVYLSRDSVFSQDLSLHLLNLMSVLQGRYNESLLRGVLIGPLFCLNYSQVYALIENEKAWQTHLSFFSELKTTWFKQGVMAMLEKLLSRNQLIAKWRGLNYNLERLLTDFRHLGEILQQKHIELEGSRRLLNWFAQKVSQQDDKEAQVRLESDANLIKIVTMHTSKGLQYPLVFIPFATGYRESKSTLYHKDGKLIYDLGQSEEAKNLAEKERLAEDLRLLYVALTRAEHYCALGMYNLKLGKTKQTGILSCALGHLLFSKQAIDSAHAWRELLQAFCVSSDDINYSEFTEDDIEQQLDEYSTNHSRMLEQTSFSETPDLSTQSVNVSIETNWRATSFSALTYNSHSEQTAPGSADENHQNDLLASSAIEQKDKLLTPSPYSFPKGAKAGSCLHEIFEQIDFTQAHLHLQNAEDTPNNELSDAVKRCLEKYQIDLQWHTVTQQWIVDALACPLDSSGLSLNKLAPQNCLIEMEFNLPLDSIDAKQINHTLSTHFGLDYSRLDFAQVTGLLKGFIDLIFCVEGKYFILDYKSNYLGSSPHDYHQDALEAAMSSHQYHLQYLIYTVALHRLLKLRIKNYDIEQHLGGVYYTFLRAMPDGKGIYFTKLSKAQVLILDDLFAKPLASDCAVGDEI
jgi:exodeoxyribonuclease V beta subunit